MANITITINDANLADVRDTLCKRWGAGIDIDTNPEKVNFLKNRIAQWIKDEYSIAKSEEAVVLSVEQVRIDALNSAKLVDIQ